MCAKCGLGIVPTYPELASHVETGHSSCVCVLSFAVIMTREEEFSHRLNKNANFCGFTPLHYASLIDSYEGVKLLLQGGNINHSEIRSRFSSHLPNIPKHSQRHSKLAS